MVVLLKESDEVLDQILNVGVDPVLRLQLQHNVEGVNHTQVVKTLLIVFESLHKVRSGNLRQKDGRRRGLSFLCCRNPALWKRAQSHPGSSQRSEEGQIG